MYYRTISYTALFPSVIENQRKVSMKMFRVNVRTKQVERDTFVLYAKYAQIIITPA